jgi:hypothetical protein
MGLNGATENSLAIGVDSPCSHSRAQRCRFFLLSLQHVREGLPLFVWIRTRSSTRLVDLSTLVCSSTWRCHRPSGREAKDAGEYSLCIDEGELKLTEAFLLSASTPSVVTAVGLVLLAIGQLFSGWCETLCCLLAYLH